MEFLLGTQGWSYADWVGEMYDAAARPEQFLRDYAQEFNTVEIDSTFYGTPTPQRVRKWAASVPDGFLFACKAPREITHERRMAGAGAAIDEFYTAIAEFGSKLGCVLFQFDASFSRTEEPALRAALAAIPAGVRTAMEFRDPAWYCSDVLELLAAHRIALAVADAPFVPRDLLADTLEAALTDFAYVRWIGDHDALARFDRVQIERAADIEWWRRTLHLLPPRVKRVFGYVNNHFAGHSPATLRALYAALGIAHVRPKRIAQTSLF